MRQATVTVLDEDGEALGLSDLVSTVQAAGLLEVDVLSCEGVRGVVRVVVEEPIAGERFAELSSVVWFERVAAPEEEHAYVVEFEAQDPSVADGACADDLVECRVASVSEDGFTFELAGSHEAISDTVAAYGRTEADVTLESIGEYESPAQPLDALTARQREVLEVAHGLGYFDVPRAATTDDVAAELDVDDSTVAEHLQRAERNLVTSMVTASG